MQKIQKLSPLASALSNSRPLTLIQFFIENVEELSSKTEFSVADHHKRVYPLSKLFLAFLNCLISFL